MTAETQYHCLEAAEELDLAKAALDEAGTVECNVVARTSLAANLTYRIRRVVAASPVRICGIGPGREALANLRVALRGGGCPQFRQEGGEEGGGHGG